MAANATPEQYLATVRTDLATERGFSSWAVLDRDAPKLGGLALVLGSLGIAVTLCEALGVVGTDVSVAEALGALYGGLSLGGQFSGWALVYGWLPVLLIVAGIVLIVYSRVSRATRLRELHEAYLARGHLAEQHSLGLGLLFYDEGSPSDLVALDNPALARGQFATALAAMRAAVGAPGARDGMQSTFANSGFRHRGDFAVHFWPELPAGIVLTTRRKGVGVVVIEADPAQPKARRTIIALRPAKSGSKRELLKLSG